MDLPNFALPAVPRLGTRFRLAGQSSGAGFGLSGAENIAASNSAHWRAAVTFQIPHREDAHLAWEGFLAQMMGTIGTVDVPAQLKWRPRDARGRKISALPSVLTGINADLDNLGLSDHGQFAAPEAVHVRLHAAATLRDGIIWVEYPDAIGLRAGQFFSLGGNLHQVRHAYADGDGVEAIHIRPLLRQDWDAGEPLEIARPVCRMRLADDAQGVADLHFERMQRIEVNFIEAVGGSS